MYILAICVSSLEGYLFRCSFLLSIGFSVFPLSSCVNCLYILEIKSLSFTSFANIFSPLFSPSP